MLNVNNYQSKWKPKKENSNHGSLRMIFFLNILWNLSWSILFKVTFWSILFKVTVGFTTKNPIYTCLDLSILSNYWLLLISINFQLHFFIEDSLIPDPQFTGIFKLNFPFCEAMVNNKLIVKNQTCSYKFFEDY